MKEIGDTWDLRVMLRTMLPVLVLLSLLEIGAGFVLEDLKHTFVANPALLVLIPVMIGIGGNLGSIMASRLSTAFHLGTAEHIMDAAVWANALAVFALSLTASVFVSAATYTISLAMAGIPLPFTTVLLITLISGILIALFVIVVSIGVTAAAFHFGVDPDDIAIPAVTNLCDVVGVLILVAVITLVL